LSLREFVRRRVVDPIECASSREDNMAITISIDNDRSTLASDPLIFDETPGVQTPSTADDGNEIDVTLPSGQVSGFATAFNDFQNGSIFGAFTLSAAQKAFAEKVDAASSASDFVTVTNSNDEVISDLFFSDAAGNALDGDQVAGMQTLNGDNVYLWSNGDFAIATTSAVEGEGRIVAAFYLNEASDHLSAQIQMVTFEPLFDTNALDPDDTLDFTDVLNVSANGSLSFDFDNLESGNFLWVAVGSGSAGLLVTGQDLNVVDTAGKLGDIVKGGSDPSDSVNTSQGGIGATIGVNAQHFVGGPKVAGQNTDGPTAVFTLVSGYVPLDGVEQATGINVNQINYDNYINTTSASIFISQVTGGTPTKMLISLWEAGGGDSTDHATGSLVPEEGYSGANSYIGDQNTDSHLHDDTSVNAGSVTIGADTWLYNEANIATGVTKNGVTVKIDGNDITVIGVDTSDTITFTALNDPGSSVDGTFNRFTVEGLAGTGAFDIGRIDLSQGITVSEAVGDSLIVDDDGPAFVAPAGGDPSNPIDDGYVQYVTGDSDTHALNGDMGTDVGGGYTITDYTTSFTYLGHTVIGTINGDSTEVHYFEDKDGSGDFNSGDVDYYTMSLTPAGSYTFTVNNAPAAPPLTFDFDSLPSGSNLFGAVADSANGPGLFVFGQDPVLSNNTKYTNASDVIHTSQGGINATIGVNNQMFDAGEGAYFTFVDDVRDNFLSGVAGGLTATEADYGKNLLYDGGLHDTGGAILGISQIQAGSLASMDLTAYSLDSAFQGTALINNRGDPGDAAITIDHVIVYDETGAKIEDTDDLGAFNDPTVAVIFNGDGSVSVNNLDAGYHVEWETVGDTFNQVLVEATGGKFDIGFFGLSEAQEIPDQFLNFTARLTDGDGDYVEDIFQVHVDAIPYIV
jgi:hypothetical protein